MKTKNYLFIFAAIFVVTACQTKHILEKNEITYTTVNVADSYPMLNNIDNPKYELQLSFTCPVAYKDEETLGKIRGLFISSFFDKTYENETPDGAVAQYVENKQRDFKILEEEFKNSKNLKKIDLVRFFYHEITSNEVVFDKGGFISFSVYAERYTGGAHSAHTQTNHVIDLQRGVFLTEDELFVADFEDKMAQILVTHIAAQNKLEDPNQLEEIGFFDIDKIAPNGNFLIDDSGITYSFNEYEIAAYSVGIIHVHIPFDAIKGLLRKGNPIKHIVNS
jgi:hypothetical protein